MGRRYESRADLFDRDAGGLLLSVTLPDPLTTGLGARAECRPKVSNPHAGEERGMLIRVVYDNNPGDQGLIADWGFACVVQGLLQTILFDTGARGDVLLSNMGVLDVEPGTIGAVVLSHIHRDHTGGLADFLQRNNKVTLFVPAAFPSEFKERVRRAGAAVVETEKAQQICRGASTTPVLGEKFVEQGLCLETGRGTVVVTGCAHPGIVEMTRAAQGTSRGRVHAVLGGFHMSTASTGEVAKAIKTLRNLGVQQAGPCHCSGDRARAMMKEAFAKDYMELAVGAQVTLPSGTTHGERN